MKADGKDCIEKNKILQLYSLRNQNVNLNLSKNKLYLLESTSPNLTNIASTWNLDFFNLKARSSSYDIKEKPLSGFMNQDQIIESLMSN